MTVLDNNPSAMAERGIVASVLLDPQTLGLVREIVQPQDFYTEMNRVIYVAMCKLDDAGSSIDLATVYAELQNNTVFASNNGMFYLTDCTSQLPSACNIERYAWIVRKEAIRRRLSDYADRLKTRTKTPIEDIDAAIATFGDELFGLTSGSTKTPWLSVKDAIHGALAALTSDAKDEFIESGFVDLDAKITGFRPGTLTIVAARPAMGKTAFGLNLLSHAAFNDGLPVAFFSLEMTAQELVYRLLSARSSINGNAIRQKTMTNTEWNRLLIAAENYTKTRIYIDETSGIDISTLRDRAKRMHRQYGIRMIIVDYLQLMTASTKKAQNREQEVATVSRGLKVLAKDLHVPVIALAQLRREVDSRANRRPLLSDLRESGSIEQDADNVLFIHREDYNKPDAERTNEAEIIIAKQRSGPTGIIKLFWNGEYTRFDNLAGDMRFV